VPLAMVPLLLLGFLVSIVGFLFGLFFVEGQIVFGLEGGKREK